MANMQERLETAVSNAETDVLKLHNIINGNDTEVITTDGGDVPSVAKQIKDTDTAIKSGVAGSILQAESARDAAVAANNAAQSAQSAALISANNAAASETNAHNSEVAASNYALASNVAKINWLGNWTAGNYNEKDAVYKDGSSYIANKTTTETPSASATDWNVLALKGTDGTGTGDVSSAETSSVDGDLVAFDGITGKQIKKAVAYTLLHYKEKVNARGSISGSQAIDLELGSIVTAKITAATTFLVTHPPAAGFMEGFVLYLTNGGAYTINWMSGIKWVSGTAPTLTSSGLDRLVFETYDGGATWIGTLSAKDIK